MVAAGEINRTVAKTVFEEIFEHNVDPAVYVEEKGLKVVNDESALKTTIEGILAANPQSVADYKGGKEKAMGFLVGQTYVSAIKTFSFIAIKYTPKYLFRQHKISLWS